MKKAGFGFYRTINSTTFMKNVISFLCFISIFIFSHTSAQTNEKKEWFEIYEHHGHVDLIFVRFDRSGKVSIIKKNETRTQPGTLT